MFEVTVKEITDGGDTTVQRYQQTVDTLDMKKIIEAVNYKKRERKPKDKSSP